MGSAVGLLTHWWWNRGTGWSKAGSCGPCSGFLEETETKIFSKLKSVLSQTSCQTKILIIADLRDAATIWSSFEKYQIDPLYKQCMQGFWFWEQIWLEEQVPFFGNPFLLQALVKKNCNPKPSHNVIPGSILSRHVFSHLHHLQLLLLPWQVMRKRLGTAQSDGEQTM